MPPLAQAQVRPTDSLSQVVHRYDRHGFPSRFAALPGGNVRCMACERDNPAAWVGLHAMHLLGSESGAGDETVVAAVQCPACEERGTLALALGPSAPLVDTLVLSLLDDQREDAIVHIA